MVLSYCTVYFLDFDIVLLIDNRFPGWYRLGRIGRLQPKPYPFRPLLVDMAPGATRPWTHCLLSYVLNRLEVKHPILMEIMLSHTPARLTTSPGFKKTSKPYGDPKKAIPFDIRATSQSCYYLGTSHIYIYMDI